MSRKMLIKVYNKMILKNTKNVFYNRFIKHQIISILEKNLWGSPSWKNILENIWSLRVSISLLLISILTLISFSIVGYEYRNDEVNNLETKIRNNERWKSKLNSDKSALLDIIYEKNHKIDSLSEYLKSREYVEYIIRKRSKLNSPNMLSRVDDDILFLMRDQADKYKIPYTIYFRLIEKESGFKFIPNNTGSGAFGYMQLMPATFRSYAKIMNLKGGHTKENNVLIGSYMLHRTFTKWKKKGKSDKEAWKFTLSEYNTGIVNLQVKNEEGKVIGHRTPTFTHSYINFIMKHY